MTSDNGGDIPEPPRLRRLRQLVTVLTATLIVGVITIVVLLVIRLSSLSAPARPTLPAAIALPAGETTRAVTMGTGWVAIVTIDAAGAERIRVLDAATGAGLADVAITAITSGD